MENVDKTKSLKEICLWALNYDFNESMPILHTKGSKALLPVEKLNLSKMVKERKVKKKSNEGSDLTLL
jgi:hypothetical protein